MKRKEIEFPIPSNDFEKFLVKCNEVLGRREDFYSYSILSESIYKFEKESKTKLEFNWNAAISCEWCSGGRCGGSCWGTDEDGYYSRESDSPEELIELDTLLEHFCPNITFIQFRQLSHLIENTERTENDYYGNYTNYLGKRLQFRKLFDFLKERNLLMANQCEPA